MKREAILNEIWDAQDRAFDLMTEYDALPHHYGDEILFQAEGRIIDIIAENPGITVTDLSCILRKTSSACSQIVRKLREKGFVEQTRNQKNNRLYNLQLTANGLKVYRDHLNFNQNCQEITFQMLSDFTVEELNAHVRVQRRINEAYQGDIQRSREKLAKFKSKK